jgi:hypothetical protein
METEIRESGLGELPETAEKKVGFAAGHLLRGMVSGGILDTLARMDDSASFQTVVHRLVGAAMTGTATQEAPAAYGKTERVEPSRRESRVA